ncbi:MAG: ROK family protein [Candidatus Omnitrophica bacterium]|nr:ROK family protein [Candidatus Omnitrophota bacterium]
MAKQYIIGVDLGGTNLKIALCDITFTIKQKAILSTKSFNKKEALISAIAQAITQFLHKSNLAKRYVVGVGLGLPGPVDVNRGLVHFFPNIPGWRNVPLRDMLQKRLGLAVVVDNDANVMALAEFTKGSAVGATNAVCITLGTGVGGGLILDKALYRGSTFAAGEIGHMPLNETGPRCQCSRMACLETYVGNARIEQQAQELFKKKISLEELSQLARQGDARAMAVWRQVGVRLGIALSGVIDLLDPDTIVIGGGVANAGRILFQAVRQTIESRVFPVTGRKVRVCKASLGSDAGMMGAAILAHQGMR